MELTSKEYQKLQALECLEYIKHYAERLQTALRENDSEMILDSSDYITLYHERLNELQLL